MSEQIRVLKCENCSLYQVDIVKKSNKWQCKVCRQKQMLQQEFFRGSGADCRAKVQELNLKRGQTREAEAETQLQKVQQQKANGILQAGEAVLPPTKTTSKWAAFVEKSTPEQAPKKSQHVLDLDESENIAATRKSRDSNKRKAQEPSVIITKKPFSKWQKFL